MSDTSAYPRLAIPNDDGTRLAAAETRRRDDIEEDNQVWVNRKAPTREKANVAREDLDRSGIGEISTTRAGKHVSYSIYYTLGINNGIY